MRAQVLNDENNPRLMVGVGPGVKARRRMENVLDPVNDQGPARVVRERDDSLDAEQAGPVRVAQDFEEKIAGRGRYRGFAGQAKCANRFAVAIDVVPIMAMIVAMFVHARCSRASALSQRATSGALVAGL